MRIPRLGVTVRSMMKATAILAVSWCMLLGIANLIVYVDHARLERKHREGAAIWEAKNEPGHAASEREVADEQMRMKQDSLSRGFTALALIALGGTASLIGLAIRARYSPGSSAHNGRVKAFVTLCSGVAKIVFVSLAIGGIIYIGILLLVLAGND